jgi:hypothetical protein
MRMRRSAALAVMVALCGALPGRAVAIVLEEDELEETSTELGSIARSFAFVLMGEPLEPPFDPIGTGILDLRFYFAKRASSWKLVIHNQLTTTIRSHDLAGAPTLGRGVSPPRWLPLKFDIEDEPTVGIRNAVDWLYFAWSRDSFTVTLGRQPVTFGRGKIWRPSDLVGTFALTEVDTEYKPGADALRVDWNPGEQTVITLVASTGEIGGDEDDLEAELAGTSIVARGKRGWERGEAGVLAGFVRGDAVAGVDGVYDTGSFEVYAEATLTYVSDDSLTSATVESGDIAGKAIAGATFRPTSKLIVSPELLYNGFGASNSADYLLVGVSERVAVGEQITLGQYYAAVVLDWEVHSLLHVTSASLANLRDPSALLSVGLSYSVSDNVAAVLGGYASTGDLPDDEFALFPYFTYFELKAVM